MMVRQAHQQVRQAGYVQSGKTGRFSYPFRLLARKNAPDFKRKHITNGIKTAILSQKHSIYVLKVCFSRKNAKRKVPPSQTSFMRGKPRTNAMLQGKPFLTYIGGLI
jgi:hypothetical protein